MDTAYRIAKPADADEIWRIIREEIEVMRIAGRTQWQYGYPNPTSIAADIDAGRGRVLLGDGKVVGYCALVYTGEPCYDVITEGNWLTESHSSAPTYSVVHRIAIDVALTGRSLAKILMKNSLQESAEHGFKSMRIDTNYDNVQMLHILPQMGFTRCGIVQLPDGPRNAFEKVL